MFLGFSYWFVLLGIGIRLGFLAEMGGELLHVVELSFVGVFIGLFFSILFILRFGNSRLGFINGLWRLLNVRVRGFAFVIKGIGRVSGVSISRYFLRRRFVGLLEWFFLSTFFFVRNWLLHISVFISGHVGFRLSSSGFLGGFLDMSMALLRVLLTVERFDFFVEILGFLQQRTALFGIVLSLIQIFSGLIMVEFMAVGFVALLVELLRKTFDFILLFVDLLSAGSSKGVLSCHLIENWVVNRFH